MCEHSDGLCSGETLSFERLAEAMETSILDRLFFVFTGHVDSSNPDNDLANP